MQEVIPRDPSSQVIAEMIEIAPTLPAQNTVVPASPPPTPTTYTGTVQEVGSWGPYSLPEPGAPEGDAGKRMHNCLEMC